MKVWVKLLAGIIIGALLALLLDANAHREALDVISRIVVDIGRYVIFPLVVCSVTIGVYELRREKRVIAVTARLLLYLFVTSLALAIVGTASTIILGPDRIPIIIEEEIIYTIPSLSQVLAFVFPRNLFLVFSNPGDYLLPVFVIAVILGLNLNFDRLATRPAIQLIDSFNRIFYNINAFALEIIALGFIPLSTAYMIRLFVMGELTLYKQLLAVLFIDTVAVVFVIYPLALYFLAGKKNPFVWIYASLATVLAAAATGDSYFTLGPMIRSAKENYGVPRRFGALGLPLFALFGKAGTAMVTGASFVLIINSYSSLGITAAQVVWVMLFSFFASLLVGPFPGIGAFVALAMLSSTFPGGYDEGFLILRPIVPVLMSFAVVVDSLTALLATALVAEKCQMRKEIAVNEFM